MTYNVDMILMASWFTKIVSKIIPLLNAGNGYVYPGHLVQKFFPRIWDLVDERILEVSGREHVLKNSKDSQDLKGSEISQNLGKVILVSGTNGKTTTATLLTHLLREAGFKVTHNASGANLLNGILTSLLTDTDFLGRFTSDFFVLEVDEFNLPLVLQRLHTDFVVLTNLSRDQLDRYGEVDTILSRWEGALKNVAVSCRSSGSMKKAQVPAMVLPKDYSPFDRLRSFWIAQGGQVLDFDLDDSFAKLTPLVGGFNTRNVNAAVTVAKALGLKDVVIEKALKTFQAAFGRGEKIAYLEKEFYVFLAKNPASFNNNLEMLLSGEIDFDTILFLLNDRIPDGRDVSWIYDIDPTPLAKVCKEALVYVGGSRALDMQIRLDYAGVSDFAGVFIGDASELGLSSADVAGLEGKKIVVLPNYSAMLEFRQLVTGQNIL
ncbi:DUF1727 domain-containing protein [candidate division WWE3 bacterium]|nr:DUF1727 domain-containing protein [candidate division WWE3 bacterium]